LKAKVTGRQGDEWVNETVNISSNKYKIYLKLEITEPAILNLSCSFRKGKFRIVGLQVYGFMLVGSGLFYLTCNLLLLVRNFGLLFVLSLVWV